MWKKIGRAGQATDDNMAHAHCMLDNQGYKHTLRTCNSYLLYPLQQWLLERSLLLPSTSTVWLVYLYVQQEHFPLSKGAGYVLRCVRSFATLR